MYTISLKLGDYQLEGKGETMLDALMSLPHPKKITAKGIVTISNGEKTKEQLYQPTRLKRMFYNKGFQAIIAKQLEETVA